MKELALNILDIAMNSFEAGSANIELRVEENDQSGLLVVEIIDDGKGIGEDTLAIIDSPFTTSRTTRNVGLGIPLIKFHAELTGGGISIRSEEGKGTRIKARFRKNHIDLQPMGDIAGVAAMLLLKDKRVNFTFHFVSGTTEFRISTNEIIEELEVSDLNDYFLMEQVKNLVSVNISEYEEINQERQYMDESNTGQIQGLN